METVERIYCNANNSMLGKPNVKAANLENINFRAPGGGKLTARPTSQELIKNSQDSLLKIPEPSNPRKSSEGQVWSIQLPDSSATSCSRKWVSERMFCGTEYNPLENTD